MSRLVFTIAAPLLAALASAAAAAPLEGPLTNQSAVLNYEIEVTGTSGGKPLRQRLMVETPVFAREADAMNPLARDFTESQNQEIAEMSAAMSSGGDGTSEMLEANRLLEAMMGACNGGEGPACVTARARYQAHEQRMAEHGSGTKCNYWLHEYNNDILHNVAQKLSLKVPAKPTETQNELVDSSEIIKQNHEILTAIAAKLQIKIK